jgi:hypothetical protein
MPPPTIIREAVSREKCDTAAAELQRTLSIQEQGAYAEYKLTPTCDEIARHAHEVCNPSNLSASEPALNETRSIVPSSTA